MGKTNDYRACELVAVWRYKHGAMVVDGVLDDLRSEVTQAIDKAEARERRKAAAVFAENTALKAQIACLKYAPQFDAENNSTKPPWRTLVLRYNDGQDKTLQIWADSRKPFYLQVDDVYIPLEPMQPQFDAEKVRQLIYELMKVSRDVGTQIYENEEFKKVLNLRSETREALLSALHIEDES